MDQLLFYLPMSGSTFKKVYFDEAKQRAVSTFVPAQDLVVPYAAADLDRAGPSRRVSAALPARGGGPFGGLPCNVWTWCSQPVCFEPDAHKHSFGDCWHKFTELPEAPEVNMRHPMRASFMQRHRNQMKDGVTWHSGALLPPGVKWTNGTWGPRAYW